MQRLRRVFYNFQHLLPQSWRKKCSRRKLYPRALAILGLTTLLCATQLPAIAKLAALPPREPALVTRQTISQTPDQFTDKFTDQSTKQSTDPTHLLQHSQVLFEQGQVQQAVPLLEQAIQQYASNGKTLAQAIALGNLCLAHQKLGQWSQATQAIDQSLGLLSQTSADLRTQAGLVDIKASLLLDTGHAQEALTLWQQSEQQYEQLEDADGRIRNRISQAQALRHLGFYRRALEQLQTAPDFLQDEPNSLAKSLRLRMLGDALRLSGQTVNAREQLDESLSIAETLEDATATSAAYLSLANVDRSEGEFAQAQGNYDQAERFAPTPVDRLQIQTNQLSLLIATQQWPAARQLWQTLRPGLAQLPSNRAGIYTKVHIAQNALAAKPEDLQIPLDELAPLVQGAIAQAKQIDDLRAESHALGTLGHIYEVRKNWGEAIQLTRQALSLAQQLNAAEESYRLNWQMGRLLNQQNNTGRAIESYDSAIQDLKALRRDLVAVNRDIQFSFRESVEPVYRESVSLLVKVGDQEKQRASNLNKARTRIEALQVAELDNFFREACLDGQSVLLDQLVDQENPNTAIIYPIILEDQLEIIVKVPGEELQHHSIPVRRPQVQAVLRSLREELPQSDKAAIVRRKSKIAYEWLIKPCESALQASEVDTLVFVLDGAFRNVPMGVLYDGQQYLIEKYALGVNLGLQLQAPKAIADEKLNVLAAGLVEPPEGYRRFPPLPGIVQEFQSLAATGVANEQIFNQDFTRDTLSERVKSDKFNVVHLATHGEFSSDVTKTFILAADGPVNVADLDGLLRNRNQTDEAAIELLILSACQTAAGDDRAALGLAGVALKAGARSTLASLWNVNDESTAVLMGLFYEQLTSNQVTKAEALRNAQLTLLKNDRYRAPASWAPYIMVGNWL